MTNEMAYIYKIYQQKSFSKAAEKLFLSQPALSLAVQRVEAELGTPLFDRRRKPVCLTPAGEKYIRAAERIQQLENDLYAEIQDMTHLRSGELTIGCTHYLGAYVLPPVLRSFTQKYPLIHVNITEMASNECLEELEEGRIHLTYSCAELSCEKFNFEFAFEDTILLAVPKDYVKIDALPFALSSYDILTKSSIATARQCVSLQLFADVPFILLSAGNNLYQRSIDFLSSASVSPHIALITDQLVTAYHLCSQGIGATFISSFLISENTSKNLLFFKIESPLAVRRFFSVINRKQYVSNAMQAFGETFTEVYPPRNDSGLNPSRF